MDLYGIGLQSRTTLANEFGKLSDKAADVLVVEVIQVFETAGDMQVLVSKVMFVDCPGTEPLGENPESLRIKQGNTLNAGILSMQEVVLDLAIGKVIII